MSTLRPRLRAALMLLIGSFAACATSVGKDWSTVGGGDDNARFSSLAQIKRSNIKTLGGAWLKILPTATRTPPVIAHGLMYIIDATSVYAVNPTDGATVWSFKPVGSAPARGGVAVGGTSVFCGLSDGHIVALDGATGHVQWTGFIGNVPTQPGLEANVSFGPGTPEFNRQVGSISNAPVYVNGMVISGLTGGDLGVAGKIAALDAGTGKLVWSFSVIPTAGAPGSETWPGDGGALRRGGGAVWTTGVADAALGLVYYGTGNAVPMYGGETRPGDNLYTASVVALDVKTGTLKWHRQLIHHDLWDMDVSTPLVLYPALARGKRRPGIAALRTDGYLFLLDRETGAPLIPIEERPVKQDARVYSAATQPFPVGADRFGPACTDPDTAPPEFKLGCYFDPLYFDQPDVMMPFITARQAPMSFDPSTGYFFMTGTVAPWWNRRVENPYVVLAGRPPGTKEYGIYAAVDSRTDRIVWQKRSPWGLAVGSGALTTAGGLLFFMQGDGNLIASDVLTGDIVWQFQTGFLGISGPAGLTGGVPVATYEAHGDQYVVAPMGNALWAFKLKGQMAPRPAPAPPRQQFGFTGLVEPLPADGTAEIAVGIFGSFAAEGQEQPYFDEFGFAPLRAGLKLGSAIRFTNYGVVTHTIVAADGSWSTGAISPAQTVSITITKAGNYEFFDQKYPFSKGQLLVR